MKIYTESIFLLNFLLDYMILYGTKRLLKKKTTNKRILLGSLLGSITTIFLYIKISSYQLVGIKIILSLLMNLISFGRKNLIETTFYFYLLSIIIGGTIYLFPIKLSFYQNIIYLLIFTRIILKIFLRIWKKEKSKQRKTYHVEITINRKTYTFEGFMDTGNQIKSPISHKSVILVELDFPEEKCFYIPYKALNTEGIIEVMKPDKVKINEQVVKSCLIGRSKEKLQIEGCNCILPNNIEEEII